jgi:hypothetical protein
MAPDENYSADYIPGMGFGASKQATRWAWIGYQVEIALAAKRPAHRPRKHPFETKDFHRAFIAWGVLRVLRDTEGPDAKMSTREIVLLSKRAERKRDQPRNKRIWDSDQNSLEQSVARGKALLEIDANWQSEVCEKLWLRYLQTT